MAQRTSKLHQDLCAAAASFGGAAPELWLIGYSELKQNGLFIDYKNEFRQNYDKTSSAWQKVFVFQHFSMNRFSIDLNTFMIRHREMSVVDSAHALGLQHKDEIFGK